MRVLSVTHGPTVPGGVFDEEVEARGHELERWVVPMGGAPRTTASYDAVMVFGGSMHPDQDERFEWLAREAELLARLIEEDVPVLGVCLGAQLLARSAGATVGPVSAPEIGWHEIELTPAGLDDPVLGTLPARTHALQWHSYTYELPDGAVELARSAACTQAFRRGRAWAIQFHAEVTQAMVESWAAEDVDELPMPAADFLAETSSRIAAWNESGRRLCGAFLDEAANR
jgi:GMP synthase-like glutamine amidotransferase